MLGLTATAVSGQAPANAPLKIFLNEVQAGVMSSPQYCTLVFDNRRFHSEKADIKPGSDTGRKIYEGQLSDSDWNALIAVIDSPAFAISKFANCPPLVMPRYPPYTISIARDKDFQNMSSWTTKA